MPSTKKLKQSSTKPKKISKKPTKVSKTRLPQPSNDIHLKDSGYSVKKSVSARRKALRKASKSHSSLVVLKRLNLIRNLSKDGSDNKKKLSDDVEYMKRLHKKNKKSAK